jgi:hypothetical protein
VEINAAVIIAAITAASVAFLLAAALIYYHMAKSAGKQRGCSVTAESESAAKTAGSAPGLVARTECEHTPPGPGADSDLLPSISLSELELADLEWLNEHEKGFNHDRALERGASHVDALPTELISHAPSAPAYEDDRNHFHVPTAVLAHTVVVDAIEETGVPLVGGRSLVDEIRSCTCPLPNAFLCLLQIKLPLAP